MQKTKHKRKWYIGTIPSIVKTKHTKTKHKYKETKRKHKNIESIPKKRKEKINWNSKIFVLAPNGKSPKQLAIIYTSVN